MTGQQPPTPPLPPRVYVIFTAEIVPKTVEGLIQARSNLAQKRIAEVYLALSTPGGSVASGITLYNFLRGTPFTNRARFAWAYRPCDELAGDALNVCPIDDRHVSLHVVDVSGHGVPSALLSMSVTRNLMPIADRSSLVTEPSSHPPGYVSLSATARVTGHSRNTVARWLEWTPIDGWVLL